jgi:hypothetical protein
MMSVVAEFFEHEFNEHVRTVLERELDTGRPAYLTFNIFNVRLDPDAGTATVEDELDPDREETLPITAFARRIQDQPSS